MLACPHTDQPSGGRVCPHLLAEKGGDYLQRFTGVGLAYDLVCPACGGQAPEALDAALVNVCSECFRAIETQGSWGGIRGLPQILVRSSGLRFKHELVTLPELAGVRLLDVQPIEGSAGLWVGLASDQTLWEMNPAHRSARVLTRLPHGATDFDEQPDEDHPAFPKGPRSLLRVSPRGDMAAVAPTYGQKGVVLDLSTGQATMHLQRDGYHSDVSGFPLAFAEVDGRLVIIHSPEWNRLDVSDPRTGALLTSREPTSYREGQARPTHYLDYFHGLLSVSPGHQFVVDNGWVWHPVGVLTVWSLPRWLHENVWESEDGPSKKTLCWRDYFWDGPLCWLDDHRLAVWGYGRDGAWLMPAVVVVDVRTGQQEHWFAGPKGALVFDEYLFASDPQEGTSVWDVATGERLLAEPGFCPTGYHRGTRQFLSIGRSGTMRLSSLIQPPA